MGNEIEAFNFMCGCGASHIAKVPEKEGDHIEIKCSCGLDLDMKWNGDSFTTKSSAKSSIYPAPADISLTIHQMALEGAKELQQEHDEKVRVEYLKSIRRKSIWGRILTLFG